MSDKKAKDKVATAPYQINKSFLFVTLLERLQAQVASKLQSLFEQETPTETSKKKSKARVLTQTYRSQPLTN